MTDDTTPKHGGSPSAGAGDTSDADGIRAAIAVTELTDRPVARRQRGAKPIIAAIAAMALGAGVLGTLALSGDGGTKPFPLALRSAATQATREGAAPSDALFGFPFEYRYVLGGTLPDLGYEATVYRLRATDLDAADVAAMAEALGITGEVVSIGAGTWEASDDNRTLMVSGDGSGWYVSVWKGPSGRVNEPGGTDPGSTGSGGAGSAGSTDPDPGDDPGLIADEPPITIEPVPPGCEVGTTDPDAPVSSDGTKPEVGPTTIQDDCIVSGQEPGPAPVPLPAPEPGNAPEPEPIPVPEDLPTDAEALSIARDLLSALGVFNSPDDWTFEVNDGTVMGTAVACAEAGTATTDSKCVEEPGETVVLSRSVLARRLVAGRPVVGLEWYIDIGDHGEVQSAGGVLADVEAVASYPLRTTADVFEDLKSGKSYGGPLALAEGVADAAAPSDADCPPDARCAAPDIACVENCPEPEIVEITVTDVTLGLQVWYATDVSGKPVQYVVPSYVFHGSFADGSNWEAALLAISEEYVTPVTVDPGTDPSTGVDPGAGTEPGTDGGGSPGDSGGAKIEPDLGSPERAATPAPDGTTSA
jgi:hypothetical protein